MGKKSRRKREKKEHAERLESLFERGKTSAANNEDFLQRIQQLEELFSQYNPVDVCVSLEISDLWLPNISSQIKHHFAMGVLLSMSPSLFVGEVNLDSYDLFCEFINKVYLLLPQFTSLEDYMPEPDWGEVKVCSRNKLLQIFYGGMFERIPDFIEGFKLMYTPVSGEEAASHGLQPLVDLDMALLLQQHLIKSIDRSVVGVVSDDMHTGHLEVPREEFWYQCREALLVAATETSAHENINSNIILHQGSFVMQRTWSEYGDSVMSGKSLPGVLAKIGDQYIPISPRSAAGVVLDYWDIKNDNNASYRIEKNIARFVKSRLGNRKVIVGPCGVATKAGRLPYIFSAILLGEEKFQFIVAVDIHRINSITKIKKDLLATIADNKDWAVIFPDKSEAIQFGSKKSGVITRDEIEMVVVIPRAATIPINLKLPPDNGARVLFLPDFITIFDSLNDNIELEQFWSFVDSSSNVVMPMFLSMSDIFSAFRDSHAVLIDGAITPTMMYLDPHLGSNWRYGQLVEFWRNAPAHFPDDQDIAWLVDPPKSALHRLICKAAPKLSWCTVINNCVLHFIFEVDRNIINDISGRVLENFVNCLADSANQRKEIINNLSLFKNKRIVTICRINSEIKIEESVDPLEEFVKMPLLSGWQIIDDSNPIDIKISVKINTARVLSSLTDAKDASFEVYCLISWLEGIQNIKEYTIDKYILDKLIETGSRKPRFVMHKSQRLIDVPDYADPCLPDPKYYKLARKEVAILFEKNGVVPGRYATKQAKSIIDPVRVTYRDYIHSKISNFDKESLVVFCIQQYDALIAKNMHDINQIKLSQLHDVDYNRSERYSELHEEFIKNARNYRYILECCLSNSVSGSSLISENSAFELIASVNWFFVLCNVSDVLHYGLDDNAGVELDSFYVPNVFYSSHLEPMEKEFGVESASLKLGIGLKGSDEVNLTKKDSEIIDELNNAFLIDVGFSFNHLLQSFDVLMQWQTARQKEDLNFSYQASRDQLINQFIRAIPNLSEDQAKRIIDFIKLDPTQIRRLIGKTNDEDDVPTWEHNKRGDRYTIKPLVPLHSGFVWGAAAAQRARMVWANSVIEGYLPAAFSWPNIAQIAGKIKISIENGLEQRASEICNRATKYVACGIDFKFRFPREYFDDVGDFDVLAYWPETNRWLAIECKYNRPPFCMKDARRLRDKIFRDDDHFTKIKRRHGFLEGNLDRLRLLLKWPESKNIAEITDLYVSKEIYWWMRNPPYAIQTQFVRIDALDYWLMQNNFQR